MPTIIIRVAICCSSSISMGFVEGLLSQSISRVSCTYKFTCHRIHVRLLSILHLSLFPCSSNLGVCMICNIDNHIYKNTVKPRKPPVLLLFQITRDCTASIPLHSVPLIYMYSFLLKDRLKYTCLFNLPTTA